MSFTHRFKKNEDGFKLAVELLQSVCSQNNLEFATVWEQVSVRDVEYLKKFHRRERKKNDPLAQVKRHRTAFSFFTQERRNLIAQNNPNLSFGQVSKLVGQEWQSLSDKDKQKYKKKETTDRKRYDKAREEIMKDLASKQVEATSTEESVPVEEAAAGATTAVTTTKAKKSSTKAKRTTRGKK